MFILAEPITDGKEQTNPVRPTTPVRGKRRYPRRILTTYNPPAPSASIAPATGLASSDLGRLHSGRAAARPVVEEISIVVGEGVEAGEALDGAGPAGSEVIGVGVHRCEECVCEPGHRCPVRAAELRQAVPRGAGVGLDSDVQEKMRPFSPMDRPQRRVAGAR